MTGEEALVHTRQSPHLVSDFFCEQAGRPRGLSQQIACESSHCLFNGRAGCANKIGAVISVQPLDLDFLFLRLRFQRGAGYHRSPFGALPYSLKQDEFKLTTRVKPNLNIGGKSPTRFRIRSIAQRPKHMRQFKKTRGSARENTLTK